MVLASGGRWNFNSKLVISFCGLFSFWFFDYGFCIDQVIDFARFMCSIKWAHTSLKNEKLGIVIRLITSTQLWVNETIEKQRQWDHHTWETNQLSNSKHEETKEKNQQKKTVNKAVNG